MITASHFHYRYNGFKFFLNGKKISRKFEKKITDKIYKKNNSNKISKTIKVRVKINPYINMINKKFSFKNSFSVLVDCANGSVSSFYKKINFLKNTNIININFKKIILITNVAQIFLKKILKNLITNHLNIV